jgi:hypothetical protein
MKLKNTNTLVSAKAQSKTNSENDSHRKARRKIWLRLAAIFGHCFSRQRVRDIASCGIKRWRFISELSNCGVTQRKHFSIIQGILLSISSGILQSRVISGQVCEDVDLHLIPDEAQNLLDVRFLSFANTINCSNSPSLQIKLNKEICKN